MKQINNETVKSLDRFKTDLTKSEIQEAMNQIMKKMEWFTTHYSAEEFPTSCTNKGKYGACDNLYFDKTKFAENWTTGFYSGMIWLAYQYSNNEKYLRIGKTHTELFKQRMNIYYHENRELADLDHHDIGFLYLLSTKADYQLTKDKKALQITLDAADILMRRYIDKAGILQAWGDLNDESQQGRLIIDCNMNVPLLYFAYEHTKDEKYRIAANNHLEKAFEYLIREDASTYHTYYVDVHTGAPKYGNTFQGLRDDSSWARGQAWGILGFSLAYRHNKQSKFIEGAKKLTHYFLNRLPKDLVCNWDLVFTDDEGQRDTSAAAIAAIGMLEIYEHTNEEFYLHAAKSIAKSLIENYMDDQYDGLVKAGVYHYSINLGINESLIFGDYYFFELIMRLQHSIQSFWS